MMTPLQSSERLLADFTARDGVVGVVIHNMAARMTVHSPASLTDAVDFHYASHLVKMFDKSHDEDLILVVGTIRYHAQTIGTDHVLCVVTDIGHPIAKSLARVVRRFADRYMAALTAERIEAST